MGIDQELEDRFQHYVKLGNNMPPQTADNMLIAYSFYKQATVGDNTMDRPIHSDVIRTFKHDAWMRLKGMSKETAMREYIAHIEAMMKEEKDS